MAEINAKILEQLTILNTDDPNVVVMRLGVKGAEPADYAMNRSKLGQLSNHFAKHAASEPSKEN